MSAWEQDARCIAAAQEEWAKVASELAVDLYAAAVPPWYDIESPENFPSGWTPEVER